MPEEIAEIRADSTPAQITGAPATPLHAPSRPGNWALVGCLLLVIATVAVYRQVRSHPFLVYDEQDYVTNNVHIQHGFDWESVRWAFTTYDNANWHPLTWLSHMLDVRMFGLNPAGHHDVNLLLHVINALLLFWVLWRTTGYPGRSLMVAALFALHPINVESVAWIAERKNLLSMMFFLLALGAYRWYACQPRAGRYRLVAALYVCGLMAKPQVITFPLVLLLWDYWPLQRFAVRCSPSALRQNAGDHFAGKKRIAKSEWRFLLLEKLPLCALSAASAMVTIKAQRAGSGMVAVPAHLRLGNAIVSYARYLGKAFWPSKLAPMYVHPQDSLPIAQVLGALALLIAITALVYRGRERRYLPVGWLWFLGTLVPMIGIVQVGFQALADRYAYLPFVGLFIMVVWGAADLLAAACSHERAGREVQRKLVAAQAGISFAALALLALLTYRQVDHWKNEVDLWEYTLQVTSNNYVAEGNLGVALEKASRPIEAIPHFFKAVALHPSDMTGNRELAMYYQRMGMLPESIAQNQKLLSIVSDASSRAAVLSNVGFAYGALGNYELARKNFEAAVRDDPSHSRAWMGLGVVTEKSGDLGHAIEDYSHSIQASPYDVAYLLLADALQKSGRTAEAQAARHHAGLLSANLEQAQRIADSLLGK